MHLVLTWNWHNQQKIRRRFDSILAPYLLWFDCRFQNRLPVLGLQHFCIRINNSYSEDLIYLILFFFPRCAMVTLGVKNFLFLVDVILLIQVIKVKNINILKKMCHVNAWYIFSYFSVFLFISFKSILFSGSVDCTLKLTKLLSLER